MSGWSQRNPGNRPYASILRLCNLIPLITSVCVNLIPLIVLCKVHIKITILRHLTIKYNIELLLLDSLEAIQCRYTQTNLTLSQLAGWLGAARHQTTTVVVNSPNITDMGHQLKCSAESWNWTTMPPLPVNHFNPMNRK